MKKFLDCGKGPLLWKSFLTGEKFLDCGKLTFLTAGEVISQIILTANGKIETIKTYILNLEQKLSSLVFFCGK